MKFNMDYFNNFTKEILDIPSPSGFCNDIINRIEKEAISLGLNFSKTKKGNGIINIKSQKSTKHIAVLVHVDTLGLIIKHITKDGIIKVEKIGGPIISTLNGEYCKIHTRHNDTYDGTILSIYPSAHVYSKEISENKDDIDNLYIRLDEVVNSKNDIEKLNISTGDIISIDPKVCIHKSGYIKSRFLDDKINVSAIFTYLKYLQDNQINIDYELSIVFSTYEEVGHGCSFLPSNIDEVIAMDMGCVGKNLDGTEHKVSICAKDASGPYDYDITTSLVNLAKENKIKHALDVYTSYSSDASAALKGGSDIKCALIGSGVHASHGMERTHIDGIVESIKLLDSYLNK